MICKQYCDALLKFFLKAGIWLYRAILSPLLGGQCRFQPSCSEYALQALGIHSPLYALILIIKRIARCHPWHPGGYDPVLTGKEVEGTQI